MSQLEERAGSRMAPDGGSQNLRCLMELIDAQDWVEVKARCERHPSEARVKNDETGQYPLHVVCSLGSAPCSVISAVVAAAPEIASEHDKLYFDTPLHIVCRNSQATGSKAPILIKACGAEGILQGNVAGATPLHSACGHNALLSVLRDLVRANPAVVRKRTLDGTSPIRALFHSYTNSIPGTLAVAAMLNGDDVTNPNFERFWDKVTFLASEFFRQRPHCPADFINNIDDYLAHGLLHDGAPLNLFKIALLRNPDWAKPVDSEGNKLLHVLVERRPYRLKESEAIKAVIEAYPEAAQLVNQNGDRPLFVAIRNKIPWRNGLGDILTADPNVLMCRDKETGLFPFQFAAAVGGPGGMDSAFEILSFLPEVVNCCF